MRHRYHDVDITKCPCYGINSNHDLIHNEQYTGNFDWIKLSHMEGEKKINFHKPIPGYNKRGNGIWNTRQNKDDNDDITDEIKYPNKPILQSVPNGIAKSNIEAKYRDGIHILSYNVHSLSGIDNFTNLPVTVDNFKPYIEEINVQIQEQVFKSITRKFQTTGEVKIEDKKNCIKYNPLNKNITVKIKVSEDLKEIPYTDPLNLKKYFDIRLKYTIPNSSGGIGYLYPIETSFDKTENIHIITFAPICKTETDPLFDTKFTLEVKGQDLAGNELIKFIEKNDFQSQVDNFKVPIRKGENEWENDMAIGTDAAMTFNLKDIRTNKDLKLEVIGDGKNIPYCYDGNSKLNKALVTSEK